MSEKKIGFTCGAFDLCHAGHMMMLRDAKTVCDHLIVGLHDDPSVGTDETYRLRTGGRPKNTPVMSLAERLEILRGIKYVDEIVVYGTEEELYNLLKRLKYDIRIIGSDWEGKPYTGHDLPHTTHYHRRNHTYSTSDLRRRVWEAERLARGQA